MSEVLGHTRLRYIAYARQLIIWEVKKELKPSISWPELGRHFGGKDHTTMIHAFNKVAEFGRERMIEEIHKYKPKQREHLLKLKPKVAAPEWDQ